MSQTNNKKNQYHPITSAEELDHDNAKDDTQVENTISSSSKSAETQNKICISIWIIFALLLTLFFASSHSTEQNKGDDETYNPNKNF